MSAVTILDLHPSALDRSNLSEYGLIEAKMKARPSGVEEIDQGGSRARGSQGDHQTTRFYRVPWSAALIFEEWLVGSSYADIASMSAEDLAAHEAFWGIAIDNVAQPPAAAVLLRRIIPAQDPVRPWLFAKDFELVKGEGAIVQDPDNRARDGLGEELEPVPGLAGEEQGGVWWDGVGRPICATLAFVDNSEGGGLSYGPPANDVSEAPPSPFGKYRDGLAIYRVTYAPRDYNVLTDEQAALVQPRPGTSRVPELTRYVTREREFALEALPLARIASQANLKYVDSPEVPVSLRNQLIPEAGVKQLSTWQMVYTWHDVPDLPEAAYARCVGKVNSIPFDGLRGAPIYPASSLLCMPWRVKETRGMTGRVTWKIQYRFSFRPQLWNRFPAFDGGFYLATFGGAADGPTVYQKADFNQLFQVRTPVRYLA